MRKTAGGRPRTATGNRESAVPRARGGTSGDRPRDRNRPFNREREIPDGEGPSRGSLEAFRRWAQRRIIQLTLEQWTAIDAEYRVDGAGTEIRGVLTIVLATLVIVAQKYFGTRRFFDQNMGSWVEGWPYPGLWGHLYWAFFCVVVYFVVPALFIRLVLHERVREYGWRLKGGAVHLPVYAIMFLIVLPFVVLASSSADFLHRYPFYPGTGRSWIQLLAWEGAYGLQFVALEFFFRGFMLFALARYLGGFAIFAMVMPYTMIHFAKPFPETLGALVAGIALGTLALRTRTLVGGICIHVGVAWTMDGLALWRKQAFIPLLKDLVSQ